MSKNADQLFHVPPEQAQATLAALLRQRLPDKSWAQIRKLIQSRRITVHGNVCVDPARRLKVGDPVKVLAQAVPALPKQEDIIIRHLDAHLVVVEKPAGMTTVRHPEEKDWPARRKQLQPTLDELLPRVIARQGTGIRNQESGVRSQGSGKKKRGGMLPKLRAVHRLDRETSGLMVFARTVEAERHLGLQFRKHTVDRRYLAIVEGHPEAQKIETRLVRDRGDGRRGSTTLPKIGKLAVTHIKPLEKLGGYSLIECRLETGRTHQIRIHLSELGHPLCGDKVYRQPLFKKPIPDKSGAARLALHAAELGFEHPITGVRLRFDMPLPADFVHLMERCRKSPPR